MHNTTILLVDDQLSSLIAIEQILEDLNAKIIKATSGKEALKIMLKQSVDCILLDVSMPSMDGFEFLSTLRDAPTHTDIPVIMVTGKTFSENESLRAYKYGAVDYLLKPLDPEIVYRKVSFIVRQTTRIKAIEGMAQTMKHFDQEVVKPLNAMRDQQAANISSSDKEIDLALLKLNQLRDLWESFDDSKQLF